MGWEVRCGRTDVDTEVWSFRALETRYRRADVEVWKCGALEGRWTCSDIEV